MILDELEGGHESIVIILNYSQILNPYQEIKTFFHANDQRANMSAPRLLYLLWRNGPLLVFKSLQMSSPLRALNHF